MQILIKEKQLFEYEASNSRIRYLLLLPKSDLVDAVFAIYITRKVHRKYGKYLKYLEYGKTRKVD